MHQAFEARLTAKAPGRGVPHVWRRRFIRQRPNASRVLRIGLCSLVFVVLGLHALQWLTAWTATGPVSPTIAKEARPARLNPDYTGTVFPPNIAAPSFVVDEPGSAYRVSIWAASGASIELHNRNGKVQIPQKQWRSLLNANRGGAIFFDVAAQGQDGTWREFQTITNRVAAEPIDSTLVYRLLRPLYNFYSEMGIYQRDLESYEQRPVLENYSINGGCLNCHTFLNHRPDVFALHIRGQKGPQPMLLAMSNQVARINKTAGYLSWHPSGELLAFSANKLSLFFHTIGETRDVFDSESDLGIYWVKSNVVVSPPAIAQPDRLETWPCWAPDGRYLYYCSAPKLKQERFRQVRYDLVRVRFDIEQNSWGKPELLVSGAETGLSAAQPRISPDGRWLVFCLAKYGNFPVYQPSSDLYLLDLTTMKMRRLEINSDRAETWHCWSSNGRWLVFSSKRFDGLFARPHFCYVDGDGRFSKPFVLPQKDPDFYDACIRTFNVPELVQGPPRPGPAALARAVTKPLLAYTPSSPAEQQHQEEYHQIRPR